MNTNILYTADRITVWQCIGCGKIEGPQPCIGVCEDHKVELVYASVHDKAIEQVAIIHRRAEALEAIVRFIAHTTPHEGKWEESYRALQDQARRTLVVIGVDGVEKTGEA
ncbi:MAG: hypothetical protein WC856_20785 [Methylococcaceae bacterium]|jgi:hypothetical protein